MSLVASTKKAAMAQRKNLAQAAGGQLWAKAAESIGEEIEGLTNWAAEKFDWEENKTAWESFEEGQKYAGVSDEEKLTAGKGGRGKLRKMFYKPEQVHKDKKITADGREFTSQQMTQLGALVSSDQRAIYEQIAGGKLAEAYSSAAPEVSILDQPNSPMFEHLYKTEKGFAGDYHEAARQERDTKEDSMKLGLSLPAEGLKPNSDKRGWSFNSKAPTQEEISKKASEGLNQMSKEAMEKMDLKSVQKSINEAKNKIGGEFSDWGKNYYQLMSEGTSQETGQSYFDALVSRRNTLQATGDKELGS